MKLLCASGFSGNKYFNILIYYSLENNLSMPENIKGTRPSPISPEQGSSNHCFRLSSGFRCQNFVNLRNKCITVYTVYHTGLFQRLSLGCRSAKAMHSGTHQDWCNAVIYLDQLSDEHVFTNFHYRVLLLFLLSVYPIIRFTTLLPS